MTFRDRSEAGRQLARRLMHLAGTSPVVVAVGCGGFPVARALADVLGAELDVRGAVELVPLRGTDRSLGAVAECGACLVEPGAADLLGISERDLEQLLAERHAQARLHGDTCRGGAPPLELVGRTAIVVADGVDGGLAPRAVVNDVRAARPQWLALAAPVVDPRHLSTLRRAVDELVVLDLPPDFIAVGYWYSQAARPTERQVAAALEAERASHGTPLHGG